MLLLVVAAELDERRQLRGDVAVEQLEDLLVDVAAVAGHLLDAGPGDQAPLGAGVRGPTAS